MSPLISAASTAQPSPHPSERHHMPLVMEVTGAGWFWQGQTELGHKGRLQKTGPVAAQAGGGWTDIAMAQLGGPEARLGFRGLFLFCLSSQSSGGYL